MSIPANKTQLKSVQVMRESSLERHWGSSQEPRRPQEIRVTSIQVYRQKRKRPFLQFQSEIPRTFYLMGLPWVTCKPQEQSLWPKGARVLSEKGGWEENTGLRKNSRSDTQEKGMETSYEQCPSCKSTKKVIKLIKLRDAPFACRMENWRKNWRKTPQANRPL